VDAFEVHPIVVLANIMPATTAITHEAFAPSSKNPLTQAERARRPTHSSKE